MARILLVDDDRELQQVTERLLTLRGHKVFCAANGAVAIKILEIEKVDLVITDMLMPEMDGCELIMALRGKTDRPRIIAISGGSGRMDSGYLLEIARVMKVDKLLHKPFSITTIEAAIAEVLQIEPAVATTLPHL